MNILIALDLSDACSKIVDCARTLLVNAPSPKVWVVHVADPDPEFVGYEAGPQSVRDAVAHRFHQEHRSLQEWAEKLRAGQVDCTALLVQGSYAEAILREAEKLKADVIVVGSHGKGMARQLLLGSASEEVIRRSGIPVLVVPTHERS
jgi:nucleotide-binding universal stress UspA family protein